MEKHKLERCSKNTGHPGGLVYQTNLGFHVLRGKEKGSSSLLKKFREICFTDEINGIEKLKGHVNAQIKKFNIPVRKMVKETISDARNRFGPRSERKPPVTLRSVAVGHRSRSLLVLSGATSG